MEISGGMNALQLDQLVVTQVFMFSKGTDVHIYSVCILLYVNYASIKWIGRRKRRKRKRIAQNIVTTASGST